MKIGEYNVSATYNGNQNYYIARNNATFNAYPWNQSQWPNEINYHYRNEEYRKILYFLSYLDE